MCSNIEVMARTKRGRLTLTRIQAGHANHWQQQTAGPSGEQCRTITGLFLLVQHLCSVLVQHIGKILFSGEWKVLYRYRPASLHDSRCSPHHLDWTLDTTTLTVLRRIQLYVSMYAVNY